MKKLFFIACGALVISLSSCSTKCTCTTTTTGLPDVVTTVESKGASCSSMNTTTTVMGTTMAVTCK